MTSPTLVAGIRQFLQGVVPFSGMAAEDVEDVARHVELVYHADGEVILEPEAGPPKALLIVKQGVVEGRRLLPGQEDDAARRTAVELVPGELFPVAALMAERPVTSFYRARGDVFCWVLPRERFDALAARSAPFLDFCRRRMGALLDLSNQALQASFAQQAMQWRSMSSPLEVMVRRLPVTAAPHETVGEVFERMEREGVGSVVVVGHSAGDPVVAGIFTRQDVIGRIVLPQVGLDVPISQVMSSPVRTLDSQATAADAMLLMAERGIRHVPVVRNGQLAGIVTERDLFALQRRSLRQIGDTIRHAGSAAALRTAAADIREWSTSLVAQGISAGFVTRLISRLNDQLTQRLVTLVAASRGLSLEGACWLALGSEGREEQTIATDQDNGLVFDDARQAERPALLAFGQEVNAELDACGYPLCKGGIMAGNPRWCLTLREWQQVFSDWIDSGDPEALLNASIFFDFRAVAGDPGLAARLRALVTERAAENRRFLKQMADNAQRNGPPPSWTGSVIGQLFSGETREVDLKLHGTAPFVDAARLYALANRIEETGTAARLERLAVDGRLRAEEVDAWVESFQFLQSLRLRVQQRREGIDGNPNKLDTRELSDIDRRILKEAFRQSRRLQQRMALDWPG